MIKLITPPGMLLTVAVLMIFASYAFLVGTIEDSWILLAGGVVAMIAAYGTAMLRPWSRYLVFAVAAGFIGKLTSSIVAGVRSGFFGFQFGTAREAIWALAPSLMMTLLSCVCCVIVYRHFRSGPPRRPPPIHGAENQAP